MLTVALGLSGCDSPESSRPTATIELDETESSQIGQATADAHEVATEVKSMLRSATELSPELLQTVSAKIEDLDRRIAAIEDRLNAVDPNQ